MDNSLLDDWRILVEGRADIDKGRFIALQVARVSGQGAATSHSSPMAKTGTQAGRPRRRQKVNSLFPR
ncbi:hypothetical protein [Pseudomonas xanthosomatis]|uniref:hypothetical protein n=1 Tax=Pseudomonas xanthosomatis TaxID=2842356 RepID=UPI0035121AF3